MRKLDLVKETIKVERPALVDAGGSLTGSKDGDGGSENKILHDETEIDNFFLKGG